MTLGKWHSQEYNFFPSVSLSQLIIHSGEQKKASG